MPSPLVLFQVLFSMPVACLCMSNAPAAMSLTLRTAATEHSGCLLADSDQNADPSPERSQGFRGEQPHHQRHLRALGDSSLLDLWKRWIKQLEARCAGCQ